MSLWHYECLAGQKMQCLSALTSKSKNVNYPTLYNYLIADLLHYIAYMRGAKCICFFL